MTSPMRALVYSAVKKVELQDIPRPVAAAGEVLIAVEMAGICGSDISGFLGHSPRRQPPLVLGHELVGRSEDGRKVVVNPLVSCGSCAQCLAGRQNLCVRWSLLGMDRVQGAYAEFVAVPERQLTLLPEHIPSQQAVLAEPLANIVHLFRIAGTTPLSTLAIIGAGTMGTLSLLLGKTLGFRDILMMDVSDERLAVASKLGASGTENVRAPDSVTRIRNIFSGGFDMVIDASGTSAARQMALEVCISGGKVVLLGMAEAKSEIDFVTSIRKEHCVLMSFAYTSRDFQHALDLLISRQVDLTSWTASLPLASGQEAFERMSFAPGSTLKMLLDVRT
jgi:2-desacetyl-2-hydroxyethyl bacteriochlorophyllide A dehydrogenase